MRAWWVGWLVAWAAAGCVRRAPASSEGGEDVPDDTQQLTELVRAAADLVASRGEGAFDELRREGSRWRAGERYVFVLDEEGRMRVHPDPGLEGHAAMGLLDVNGRPIVRGLIDAATRSPRQPEGWYHYQWPVPGGLLPRWKSSFVRWTQAPSGRGFVVGSGLYDDRMTRPFVVDLVQEAARRVEARGRAAFPAFYDVTGPFRVKDAYVFVIDRDGRDLVNPAFPSLEGKDLRDLADTRGKRPVDEMLRVVEASGEGWVDYMWPKPGEAVSTRKSAYVRQVRLDGGWALVGCGVYLADAPEEVPPEPRLDARGLVALVGEAAALVAREGESAYAELRRRDTKWFRGDVYFFAWTMDGVRRLHAADPRLEGSEASGLTDVVGRPVGRMVLEAAQGPAGEGWVHYMYPEPGSIFPAWKSTFVKRVTLPGGGQRVLGAGLYAMQLDEPMVEALVDRAAALVAARGREAFPALRDRAGPFVFMDTYVFVDDAQGVELVNPGHPSLEGKGLLDARDARGKPVVRAYLDAARRDGRAWVDYEWYRPGHNEPARKRAYVRRVQAPGEVLFVGSGYHPRD
jgi:signal transduction histidine kinase